MKLLSFSIPDTYHAYFGEIYDIFYGAEVEPTINFLISITNLFNISLIQSKILDLGCGTGRLLIPLLERGLTIVGSEPSKAMREIVRDKLNKKSLYTTIYEFYAHQIMPIGSFNIILLIDNVFQNYLTRREQIEALNVLYSSLESKGLVIFDFANYYNLIGKFRHVDFRKASLSNKNTVWLTSVYNIDRINAVFLQQDYIAIPETGQTFETEHKFAIIAAGEFKQVLFDIGFKIVKIYGSFDHREEITNNSAQRLIIVAQK